MWRSRASCVDVVKHFSLTNENQALAPSSVQGVAEHFDSPTPTSQPAWSEAGPHFTPWESQAQGVGLLSLWPARWRFHKCWGLRGKGALALRAVHRGREPSVSPGKARPHSQLCSWEPGGRVGSRREGWMWLRRSSLTSEESGSPPLPQPGDILNCWDPVVTPPLHKTAWFQSRLVE